MTESVKSKVRQWTAGTVAKYVVGAAIIGGAAWKSWSLFNSLGHTSSGKPETKHDKTTGTAVSSSQLAALLARAARPQTEGSSKELPLSGLLTAEDVQLLASVFIAASEHIKGDSTVKSTDAQKLELYALFKQATIGPCTVSAPALFQVVERAKWNAWHQLAGMTQTKAKAQYIELVAKLAPKWEPTTTSSAAAPRAAVMDEELGVEVDVESRPKRAGGFSLSQAVSRPADVSEDPSEAGRMKDITDWAAEGRLDEVKAEIAKGVSVNYRNDLGNSALHMAVDQGRHAVVLYLLEAKADPNVTDNDGQSPLHLAVTVDRDELIEPLLESGARPDMADADDITPLDIAEGNIRVIINSFIKRGAASGPKLKLEQPPAQLAPPQPQAPSPPEPALVAEPEPVLGVSSEETKSDVGVRVDAKPVVLEPESEPEPRATGATSSTDAVHDHDDATFVEVRVAEVANLDQESDVSGAGSSAPSSAPSKGNKKSRRRHRSSISKP